MLSQKLRCIETPELADRMWRQFYQVSPVVLVTTMGPTGRLNVAPKTQVTRIGRGPLIGFGCTPSHHTYQNIAATGEYVIGYPGVDLLDTLARCGRGFSVAVADEIAAAGLTPVTAKEVKPPRLAECPISLECKLLEIRDYGEYSFIVGRVVVAWIDEEKVVNPERPATEQLAGSPLLTYVYPDHYAALTGAEKFPFRGAAGPAKEDPEEGRT